MINPTGSPTRPALTTETIGIVAIAATPSASPPVCSSGRTDGEP
jgi:hypothetical protein